MFWPRPKVQIMTTIKTFLTCQEVCVEFRFQNIQIMYVYVLRATTSGKSVLIINNLSSKLLKVAVNF